MKILRKGRKTSKFIKRCPLCDCIFEYDMTDTKLSYEVIRYGVKCPNCGGQLYTSKLDTYSLLTRFLKLIYQFKLKLYNLWKLK